MEITREQYDENLRKAKSEALRDYAQFLKGTAPEDGMVHIDDVVENMRDDADEMESGGSRR